VPTVTFDGEVGHRACLNQQIANVARLNLPSIQQGEQIARFSARNCNVMEGLGLNFERFTGSPLAPIDWRVFTLDFDGIAPLALPQTRIQNGIRLNLEWATFNYRIAPTLNAGQIELESNQCYLLQTLFGGEINYTDRSLEFKQNVIGMRWWLNYYDPRKRQMVEQSILPTDLTITDPKQYFIVSAEPVLAINSGIGDLWVALDVFSRWAVSANGSHLIVQDVKLYPVRASDYCQPNGFVQL
jgi:hypothetical protein